MRKIIIGIGLLTLAACGGGGGGGGSGGGAPAGSGGIGGVSGCTNPKAFNYSAFATTDDGSCYGGNANTSYYGYRLSGTEITDAPLAGAVGTGGNNIRLDEEFFLDNIGGNRDIALAIYQPKCNTSATPLNYNMLLMNDIATAPTAITVRLSKDNFYIYHQGRYTNGINRNVGPGTYGLTETLGGSCLEGKVTLTAGRGVVYANGRMAVFRDASSGAVYVGVKSDSASAVGNFYLNAQAPAATTFGSSFYYDVLNNLCTIGVTYSLGCQIGGGALLSGTSAGLTINTGTVDTLVSGTGTLTDQGQNNPFIGQVSHRTVEPAGAGHFMYALPIYRDAFGQVLLGVVPLYNYDTASDGNGTYYTHKGAGTIIVGN